MEQDRDLGRDAEEYGWQVADPYATPGVFIWVHTHGRLYDPSNGKDRETLLTEAVKAEAQAWELSQRITRAGKANVTEGRPSGPCPYGYERTYDPRLGRWCLRTRCRPRRGTSGS